MIDRPPDPRVALHHGLAVFPIAPGGKLPAERGWQRTATTDPRKTDRWWRPGDNIGVGCWRSAIVGLDLDVRGGADGTAALAAACAARNQPWPRTLTVTTPSGGCHLYFASPPGRLVTTTNGRTPLGSGVDVRGPGRGGRGGYLIGPDSLVGGRRYTVTTPAPPAPLPGWLTDLLAHPDPTATERNHPHARHL